MADRRGADEATFVVTADDIVDAERQPRFLGLRRLALRIEGPDGVLSAPGVWDFVERPAGTDAVVVVVFRRVGGRVEALLRRGLRVPVAVGRPEQPRGAGRRPAIFVEETVAGLIEAGEEGEAGLFARARAEVLEEAGLDLPRERFFALGGPLWASPGLCAEVLHYFAADATGIEPGPMHGDGSPFESLGSIAWYPLAEAIARVAAASPGDLRTELGFRRLADHLARERA